MHGSRPGAALMDCCRDDLDAAAALWSAALGRPVSHGGTSVSESGAILECPPHEVDVSIQKVDHAARVHIDIETTTSRRKCGDRGACAPARRLLKRQHHARPCQDPAGIGSAEALHRGLDPRAQPARVMGDHDTPDL